MLTVVPSPIHTRRPSQVPGEDGSGLICSTIKPSMATRTWPGRRRRAWQEAVGSGEGRAVRTMAANPGAPGQVRDPGPQGLLRAEHLKQEGQQRGDRVPEGIAPPVPQVPASVLNGLGQECPTGNGTDQQIALELAPLLRKTSHPWPPFDDRWVTTTSSPEATLGPSLVTSLEKRTYEHPPLASCHWGHAGFPDLPTGRAPRSRTPRRTSKTPPRFRAEKVECPLFVRPFQPVSM